MTNRTSAARAPRVERVEDPVFRATKMTSVGGLSYKEGETSTRWGSHWPERCAPGAWAPGNESAKRLANYYARYHASRFFPAYPAEFDGVSRRFYLPAGIPLDRLYNSSLALVDVPSAADEAVGEHVPRYMAPGRSEPFVFFVVAPVGIQGGQSGRGRDR